MSSVPPASLNFKFNERKATQAAAVVLTMSEDCTMNYMKLLKLLYLADKAALLRRGTLITGSTLVTMARGPLSSEVLDCIRSERYPGWKKCIKTVDYNVKLVSEPGDGELSSFDVKTLRALQQEHAHRDEWDMVKYVHTLAEVKDVPEGSREPLRPEEILRVEGVDESEIRELASRNRSYAALVNPGQGHRRRGDSAR